MTFLASTFLLLASVSAGEIDVARQALRDGLWEVARTHARKAEGDLAKIVVLESFARERKWADVLATVEAYGNTDNPDLLYYRAAALYQTGKLDAARRLLESVDYSRGASAADASRLHAAVLRKEGYVDAALAKLASSGGDADSKMIAAAIHKSKGEDAEAAKIWREVVAMTNAPERAVVIAAANLSDAATLRRMLAEAGDRDAVRFAGLRLGALLIRGNDTFEEGSKLIRKIAKTSPDFPGARAAFLALADTELARGSFAAAALSYREAMEIWPDTSREASVRLGLGWALAETGSVESALAEFSTVASLTASDETKSLAVVRSGDVLAKLGKREEAMARYREAMEKFPDTASAAKVRELVAVYELEQRGRAAFSSYRFTEARRAFAEVAKRDASLASRMEYCDMVCLYGLGRDVEAERRATALSRQAKDAGVRADALEWLAKYLYNRGRYREAESNFIAVASIAVSPATIADSLLWSARAAFAAGDFARTIQNATRLTETSPGTRESTEGLLVQTEALIELARFDEAILVAERVIAGAGNDVPLRLRARLLRADALFAMGADNPARYQEALNAYTSIRTGETMEASVKIRLAYKLAKTLERLKRLDEAIDEYYVRVVLAYRDGRQAGVRYDDDALAAFSRAAFRLAEEYESRGSDRQAVSVLKLVATANVPASAEAGKRIERIHRKGNIL